MEPGTRRDSVKQFASASSCGGMPAPAEILFNVSPGFTIYGIQPVGGLQAVSSAIGVLVFGKVGVRAAVKAAFIVEVGVTVSCRDTVTVCRTVGVMTSILSRVG